MSEHPTIEEVYKRPEYFDAVWSKSIEYYCVTKQSVVCMEECAELIEAYDDRKRDGLTDGTRSHMVEEMAGRAHLPMAARTHVRHQRM